jgi:glycosyltransferase involved in cell wall biosynthesis
MACGRPVLAANAVALPELVSDGLNGYLFHPGDDLDAARCMEKLTNHPELWPGMGAASLERARQHSLDVVLQRNETLYEMVLSGSVVTESKPGSSLVRNKKREEGRRPFSA